MDYRINFPNLGIHFSHVGKTLNIGGFGVAYYGIVIVIGMLIAISLIMREAKRAGMNEDHVYNCTLITLLMGIAGARVYYVIFNWSLYRGDIGEILNLRHGGLAIYGGIIFGYLTTLIYAKTHGYRFFQLSDLLFVGVIIGQIMGRWGNFFNREAFGEYTNGLLAMQLPVSAVRQNEITPLMWEHAVTLDGTQFVQVSPTFLYESLWNICILVIMMLVLRRRKFEGETTFIYFLGYGLGRLWIESLRTDQLLLPVIHFPVSQVVSLILITAGTAGLVCGFISIKKQKNE